MKKLLILLAAVAVVIAIGLSAKKKPSVTKEDIVNKTFVWEKKGFGSEFSIKFNMDGTYSYYEGVLSSYIGFGKWSIEDNTVILDEITGYDWKFRFSYEDDSLIYLAEGSDKFLYVTVQDGDRFNLKKEN